MDRREFRLRVWEQEYENIRYQDMKRWNRFRWVFLIEGAMLYFTYIDNNIKVFPVHKIAFIAFCFLMIFYITMLIYKDGLNARGHKFRKNDYEILLHISGYPGFKLPPLWRIQGYHITLLGLSVLNIFNCVIIIERLVSLIVIA